MSQKPWRQFGLAASFLLTTILAGCVFANDQAATDREDPAVVSTVDLEKYMGLWYEIAHSPNFFQRNCVRSTAEYTLNDDGSVRVYNVCTKADGSTSDIEGVATVNDPSEPAKLTVDFGLFRKGDYWIIDLAPDYQWAVVSGPKKESLFILSRTAPMDPALLQEILDRLAAQGFKVDEFVFDQY